VTVSGVPAAAEEVLTLDMLGRPTFELVVYGIPGPQGSKKPVGRTKEGRPILVESSAKVKPWRLAVTVAALAALPRKWAPMDGPLVMDLILSMPKPLSEPKTLRTLPHRYPDLDKLVRSTADALATDCKKYGRAVIADDSRLVSFRRLCEVYAGDSYDSDALQRSGAVIRLWHYPPQLIGKLA
jgi:Holliday junction resolvase RusA-like endonuclease